MTRHAAKHAADLEWKIKYEKGATTTDEHESIYYSYKKKLSPSNDQKLAKIGITVSKHKLTIVRILYPC